MEPIHRAGLADKAARLLREEILKGRLTAGMRLNENDLAQELDISRAPVREALMQLERKGLVISERYRGARVVVLAESDIEELVSLRSALEPLAWARACQTATAEDLDALDRIVDRMRESITADAHEALVLLDIEFHDRVFQAASHERLYAAWSAIVFQVALYLLRRRVTTDDYHRIVVEEHQQLVTVLRARDEATARVGITAHISAAYDRLTSTYESVRELPRTDQMSDRFKEFHV